MSESIAVHSDKHFQSLMEQSGSEIDGDLVAAEDQRASMGEPLDTHTSSVGKPRNFDMLALGGDSKVDFEINYNEDKDNSVRFINQGELKGIDMPQTASTTRSGSREGSFYEIDDNGVSNEYEKQHQILLDEYNRLKNQEIFDSLDMSGIDNSFEWNQVDPGNEQYSRFSEGIQQRFENRHDTEVSEDAEEDYDIENPTIAHNGWRKRSSQLKPGFTFKEPEPKFIVKNRVEVGKRNQGSYCQKYLMEMKIGNSNLKKGEIVSQDNADLRALHGMEEQHNSGVEPLDQGNQQNICNNNQGNAPVITGGMRESRFESNQPNFNLNNLRENFEISRLEEMIREEEENLKNNVLNIELPQMIPLNAQSVAQNGFCPPMVYQNTGNQNIANQDVTNQSLGNQNLNIFQTVSDRPAGKPTETHSHVLRKESYAQLHAVAGDKQTPQSVEPPQSYAVQHLEKRNKHVSYKKYGLKDYKALNKEIVLQRSLGPDKLSNDYLQKKARADRLKDYASAVSVQNRERIVLQKAKSAPAPVIKDRMNESRRAAALEYAKSVKNANFPRKPSKSTQRQRPSSENGHEQSALEIMKERHESERLAVEKMRQNLANIIREVKS